MKKYFAIGILLVVLLSPLSTFAAPLYPYTINSYNINMVVNENNTFNITENISAFFNTPKHGIYRYIPLENKIVREDGTSSTSLAKISNINVGNQFTTSTSNGNRVIQIGDPNVTLTGAQNYTINYTYNIGKDTGKGYDELYYNLIGTGWDTTISNVTFKITMPKSFDASQLGFSAGPAGTSGTTNVKYSVNGNVITGSYTGTLNPGDALTVRLQLPDGYFVGASNNIDFIMWLALILPILFVIIYFFVWRKYGKDNVVVETVEFYPPEGLNSAEVGFMYRGVAEDKDVVSLLIYLANKGYLKIDETEHQALFGKTKGFKVTKIKEYDGDNENEKIFMEGLFASGNEATDTSLNNTFYTTLNQIKANLTAADKEKVYEKTSLNKIIWGVLMIVVDILLLFHQPAILATYIIGGVSIILILILIKIMPKRTPFGTDVLGKIKGFRNFLEIAEKEKLNELVNSEPEYFYNILPFTYVLGVSDKWISKFESITTQPPVWYGGTGAFNMLAFSMFINSTMITAGNTMASRPQPTGSGFAGGFSGGGFSGGGFGGGGGGSW